VNRFLIFQTANKMVDSDQSFMWLGTKDYADGKFYEPRFYGQDYNTFLESLVAVPFYKAGMPVYQAVPLATHLLFLFPLFFTLIYLFKIGKERQAIAGACLILCLTTAFDIMSSLPRGFVTGVFFTSFFILSIQHPKHLGYLILNIVMLMIGYFVNPNLALAIAPLLFYVFLHNYRSKGFWACLALMPLLYIPLYFVFDAFYKNHPEYVVYGLVHSFSATYFFQNITHLDQCFAHISFFFEDNSLTLLVAFAGMTWATWYADKKVFFTWIVFLLVLLAAFFTGKTREGTFWPYYSYSRMYIALPFVLIYFLSLLPFRSATLLSSFLFLTLCFESYKLSHSKTQVAYHTDYSHATGVRIYSLDVILDGFKVYKHFCTENKSDHLVISTIFWLSPYLNYGAQAVDPSFPSTEESWSDRRYWVWKEKRDTVYERFNLISVNYDFDKYCANRYPFELKRLDDYGAYLVYNNHLKNKDFMSVLRNAER
jgi:hypothetical protein